jgi:hypothetical protein
LVLAGALAAPSLRAQQAAEPAGSGGAKPAYAPGLGDFMLTAQARHAKLWLSGNAQNWELAEYELEELKEGFEDTAKLVPTYKEVPVAQMIETMILPPIGEVESAVKSRDRTKFVSAFDKLTESCNGCHQAANRPFLVIQRPTTSPFPNQNFTPVRR